MKKLISSILALAMALSASAMTTFAAETATLYLTDDVTTAVAGDIVEPYVVIDTTKSIVNYSVTIKYDKDVFELVETSAAYDAFAADADNIAAVEEVQLDDPSYSMATFYYENTYMQPMHGDAMVAYWEANSGKVAAHSGMEAVLNSENYPLFIGQFTKVSTAKAAKNAVMAAALLKVKADAPIGETVIETTNFQMADGSNDITLATTPITVTIEGGAPTTANVTVADNANALVEVSKTGEVAIGEEITVSVKPMAGFEIVDAFDDALLGMGGEITFAVTENIEIAVTAAEDDAKPAVVAIAFVEDFGASDCVTFFGKAPAAAAEFGIDIGATFFNEAQAKEYGPKLAAKSMSAAGFYGVKIHNLPEGEYNVSAYADAATSAAFAFAK